MCLEKIPTKEEKMAFFAERLPPILRATVEYVKKK